MAQAARASWALRGRNPPGLVRGSAVQTSRVSAVPARRLLRGNALRSSHEELFRLYLSSDELVGFTPAAARTARAPLWEVLLSWPREGEENCEPGVSSWPGSEIPAFRCATWPKPPVPRS